MIWGRPTNLWLGLTTAISGAIAATAIVLGADGETVGILSGVWSGVLGAGILLIANQPPTILPGDQVTVLTPQGEDNRTVTVH